MREVLPISGLVRIRHIRNGVVLFEHEGENIVTAAGKTLIAQIMAASPGPARPGWIALGDDDTPPDEADTTLGSENSRDAVSTSQSVNEVTYNVTHTAAGPETVAECGIFNAAVAGTMLARFLTQEIDMVLNDELEIDWTLNYGG